MEDQQSQQRILRNQLFTSSATREGDIVYLELAQEGTKSYLYGNECTREIGFQSDRNKRDFPLDFEDCLWRIIPQLSYQHAVHFDLLSSPASMRSSFSSMRSLSSRSSDGDFFKGMDEQELAKDGEEREKRLNLSAIEQVTNGKVQQPVSYGSVIQLMHLKTGLFLTAKRQAALSDREALRLTLIKDGAFASGFELKPSIKMKSEGQKVQYQDEIYLMSFTEKGYAISYSKNKKDIFNEDLTAFEAYVSGKASALRIQLYSSGERASMNSLMVGLPVRLYHYEAESFVQADAELKHTKAGLPCKPFLKKEKDHENKMFFAGTSVWSFELENKGRGGEIGWGNLVKVRHLASGKYLAMKWSKNASRANECPVVLVDEKEASDAKMLKFTITQVDVDVDEDSIIEMNQSFLLQYKDSSSVFTLSLSMGSEGVEEEKSGEEKVSSDDTSWMVFRQSENAKNALQIVNIPEQRIPVMKKLIAYRNVAEEYVKKLQMLHHGSHFDEKDFEAEKAMLEELILELVIVHGDSEEPLEVQGPSRKFQQDFAREVKLIDAVVNMLEQATKAPAPPVVRKGKPPSPLVHKLAFKALMHIYANFPENEFYFANYKEGRWVSYLINQVKHNQEAADCLTTLISNNSDLLKQFVSTSRVEEFKILIANQGPKAPLMRFFQGICSCLGKQILCSQEQLLRDIYLNKSARDQLLITHCIFPNEKEKHGSVQVWESESDKRLKNKGTNIIQHYSKMQFLGKEEWEKGFNQDLK
mmetsp:Transcript_8598/g.11348  ORF Transcript_8598/g.11348 Transcript_8598/m.11348 type:complete len:757 (+) Transcript_8598:207-2477(+)